MIEATNPQWQIQGLLPAIAIVVFLLLANSSAAAQEGAKYKVGDCVEFDTTNAVNPDARWRKGRIKQNDGYFFIIELEARDGGKSETTRVSLASANRWLRVAKGCADKQSETATNSRASNPASQEAPKAKRQPEAAAEGAAACPFNKNYAKVSNNAPASAELFKGVIFEWEYDLNKRFRDFGLTFLSFQMSKAFKNQVYPGINVRKDVDAAPVGATIYPVKAKVLICQKDISLTIRRVWEIEYNCFKDKFGAWVCKNNAPKQLEHTSMPNQ